MRWSQSDLDQIMAEHRTKATVKCRLLRPLAGGLPAGEDGVKLFVEYQLHIPPETEDFEAAVARILKEEIGERKTDKEGDELETSESYQVNVIRRSERGAWIAEHQIKALIKQAASRLGLFSAQKKRGSKGDIAELGTVKACGDSLQDPKRPWEIYLRDNGKAVKTSFVRLSGSVGTPKGKKSIQHDTEVAPEGTEFEFELWWPAKRLDAEDMAAIMAAATQIGLGSCLSLGYGRFVVIEMTA